MDNRIKINTIQFNYQTISEVGRGVVGFISYPPTIYYTFYSQDGLTKLDGEYSPSLGHMLEMSKINAEIELAIMNSLTKSQSVV